MKRNNKNTKRMFISAMAVFMALLMVLSIAAPFFAR
jgi:hypothetical protein